METLGDVVSECGSSTRVFRRRGSVTDSYNTHVLDPERTGYTRRKLPVKNETPKSSRTGTIKSGTNIRLRKG